MAISGNFGSGEDGTLLYPNGSKESGFVNGNGADVGDPMGWMPKGLRSRVQVVDPVQQVRAGLEPSKLIWHGGISAPALHACTAAAPPAQHSRSIPTASG